MKILNKKMPDNFNLFLVGDAHVGSVMFYEKGFLKMVDMVESEWEGVRENFVVDHGDHIEGVTINDYRFLLETNREPDMIKQCNYVVDLYHPIKDRLLVLVDGNHPWKLKPFGELTKYTAKELGTEYGTWSGVLKYYTQGGELMFRHFYSHGFSSINSSAEPETRAQENMKIKLVRLLRSKMGDCALMSMGHTHKLLVREPVDYLTLNTSRGRVREKYTGDMKVVQTASFIPKEFRWYVNTGTFRRTFLEGISDYGERAGYDPIPLGFAIAEVRDRRLVGVKRVFL